MRKRDTKLNADIGQTKRKILRINSKIDEVLCEDLNVNSNSNKN